MAESDGNLIGMLQSNAPSMAMSARLATTAVFLYGPFFMKWLTPRIQLLHKVRTTPPPGSYQISELHVAPEHRGRGFSRILLGYTEKKAIEAGYPSMSLQTWTINPAVHLYERAGYKIVETCTIEGFKQLTGAEGNHLMVKGLSPANGMANY